MDTVKVDLKLFAATGTSVDPEELIPVFHGWIRDSRLDDLLIDVADYRHVHHGPEVQLVGHDAHYVWDRGEGLPGLLYSRRRETHPAHRGLQDLHQRLGSVARAALEAARQLEEEPALDGRLRFRSDRLLLRLNDRLAAPQNGAAGEASLRPYLDELMERLYPGVSYDVERPPDPRAPLSLHVRAAEAPPLSTLLERAS